MNLEKNQSWSQKFDHITELFTFKVFNEFFKLITQIQLI